MIPLFVATRNRDKWQELQTLLADLGLAVHSACDRPTFAEVVEDGATFFDNALRKARAGWQHTGLTTLADDSGLCVDALGGAPGVHSSRFGGDAGNSARNNARLLAELQRFAEPQQRSAHFACTLVLLGPQSLLGPDNVAPPLRPADLDPLVALQVFVGQAHGTILHAPRGQQGFGYDPLFESADVPGCTFAELSADQKNRFSHRGRALAGLKAFLRMRIGTV